MTPCAMSTSLVKPRSWLTDPAACDITATALDMSGGITAGFPDEAGW